MLPQAQTYENEESHFDAEESYVFGDCDGWSLDVSSENDSSCNDDAYAPVDKTSHTHTQSTRPSCPCG